ncbi:HlyD family type I secretion periplasmic adaptor subunit, partial [Rahnella inusitata]
ELRSNQDQVHKLEQIKKIELQRSKDYQALLEKKYLSQHEYFEQDSKTIQNEHDLRSLRNQTQQIEESIHQAEQEKRLNIQTFHRDTLDALREANEQIPQLRGQLEKAEQRQSLMNLKAPVDGTVQQMAFHTLGGVVMEGQAIMTIVPLDDKIEVETMIANKDIGFVNVGQDVVVKIESFPYTRYGYITGKVTSVSFDAIENEKLGLVFSAIVSLDKNYLLVEGKRINLVAGMNVSAEIKTGKRKVIDYLLSPLQTKVDESFKER